jgi:hypothetical protein
MFGWREIDKSLVTLQPRIQQSKIAFVQTLELWRHRTKKESRRIAIKSWTQNWEKRARSSRALTA